MRARTTITVAVTSGLLLGPLDLLAQRTIPYPWANLANSGAVWAIAAFGLGFWVRDGRRRPAIAGVVLLLMAVETYELAAILALDDAWANLWSPATLAWLVLGSVAGVVFGTAGAWSRAPSGWGRIAGMALPGGILLAEAGVLASRSGGGDAAYRSSSLQTAAIDVALAIGLTLVLAATTRRSRRAEPRSAPEPCAAPA